MSYQLSEAAVQGRTRERQSELTAAQKRRIARREKLSLRWAMRHEAQREPGLASCFARIAHRGTAV